MEHIRKTLQIQIQIRIQIITFHAIKVKKFIKFRLYRTTVMIRNIPIKYTDDILIE